ncbi:MAG: uracil-DNA glycosylase [Planctomycetes bacterium]|jgi:DNA polymerase|nr:uracil-DNA glycosylase [Planctomycetota bacterium]MCL4731895.1 uracil-DNA glycosylase [Planctomycetota bacterium]
MARITRTRLARQLRGNLELLQLGGVNELPVRQARKPAARPARGQPAPAPAALHPAPQARTAPAKVGAPVVVPSAALQELKAFDSPQARALEPVAEQVRVCGACKLCSSRTQTVFGTGDPRSPLMIVGEAPGGDEDARGVPFVGRAGKLLTDIIEKGMKYRREHVYICNVLKCRPPGNRNPEPDEIEACRGFLARQIEIINPKVILAVGLFPAQWLTGRKEPIGRLRGQVFDMHGRKVIATYHPAYVLRNYTVEVRKKVHEDVLLAVGILGPGPLVA